MRPLHRRVGRAFRAAWREIFGRSVFDGAAFNRLLMDFVSRTMSADSEIKGDLRTLRGRARTLARNNSYVKRFFRLLQNNVIGPMGIRLQAQVMKSEDEPDDEVNRKIETAWSDWASSPVTVDGKLTLRRFERLLIKTIACDGEVFVRLWRGIRNRFGLSLQAIDADLLDETYSRPREFDWQGNLVRNEIRMGIEIDEFGAPVGYWFWNSTDNDVRRERYFVPAIEIVHLYDPDRCNQTRGVTWVHSVMVTAQMLNEYEKSEAVAARIGASKMGLFQKKDSEYGGGAAGDPGKKPASMTANPGSFDFVPDGYELTPWAPEHPTTQFAPFVKQLARKIASGFSVFYNILANDAEGITYSTARTFILVEHDDWRSHQQDFIDMWRRPLYLAWIKAATLSRALRLPSEDPSLYLAVRHRPRGWEWIDPEKEANAAVTRVQNNFDSEFDICADRGEDFEEICQKRARARKILEKYGLTSSGKTSASKPDPDKDGKDELANAKPAAANGNGDGEKSDALLVRLVAAE